MWSHNVSFSDGVLHIAGLSAATLAEDFGTPTFFLDKADFFARAREFKNALEENFGPQAGRVYYASKAFTCTEVGRWIKEIGIGIDVSTAGEMAVALAAGISPSHIQVHGNNKSLGEIDTAVSLGVASIVIDSFWEIDRVAKAASQYKRVQDVLVRVTPGVEAHTHEAISTAHEDVKFGLSIASGAAWEAIERIRKEPSLRLVGLHAHIGSQIFSHAPFRMATERLVDLLARYKSSFHEELAELDLGGGYGIGYLPQEEAMKAADVIGELKSALTQFCAARGISVPRISIEPGRAIVGPSMCTLYQVGTTKDVTLEDGSLRRYISIDGGMSDNIRPALYGAEYFAVLANRNSTAKKVSSRIVGKHCETGDIVIRSIDLPADIAPGDLIAIPATGAYGRSMASNYNHVPRPPVVAVENGKARIIVRRETVEDLLSLDL